jgi:hypothetical protein
MIEYYKNLMALSHPHHFPLPPGRERGFTPSPPETGERVGVRGMLPTGCLVDRKLSLEKKVALVVQVIDF